MYLTEDLTERHFKRGVLDLIATVKEAYQSKFGESFRRGMKAHSRYFLAQVINSLGGEYTTRRSWLKSCASLKIC